MALELGPSLSRKRNPDAPESPPAANDVVQAQLQPRSIEPPRPVEPPRPIEPPSATTTAIPSQAPRPAPSPEPQAKPRGAISFPGLSIGAAASRSSRIAKTPSAPQASPTEPPVPAEAPRPVPTNGAGTGTARDGAPAGQTDEAAATPARAPKPPARIGDRLVEMGLISRDQLDVAIRERTRSQKMMGELLVELGFISEQVLSAVIAETSGYERFDLDSTVPDVELVRAIPQSVASRYRLFPISLENDKLRVAMADAYDVLAIDQVNRYFPANVEVVPVVASENSIQAAIDKYYGHELSITGILKELESGQVTVQDLTALDEASGYTHPLVRLVNAFLLDAVKNRASDIHFEPERSFVRVRYRIDGEMTQVRTIHKDHWPAMSHRLKIVSGMNIADRLNPQDGRLTMSMGAKKIDFRVSSLPTVHGENIVLRILDKSSALVRMQDLGFSDENFALLNKLILRPEGVIIVTGPTGSGKTTTLYSILHHINSLDKNIMTLEDPVEYELSVIRQAQVREGGNLTFGEGIRSILRQDPDVVLVGEIRDSDTATMAMRAAMTGHQVYTTLHTNDAAGAFPRLIDLGLRPTLMAGNIIAILAQRLARLLCNECKQPHQADAKECRLLGVPETEPPPTIYRPVGCIACRHTGYRGRTAVSEILPMNSVIDELIMEGAPLSRIRHAAAEHGFVPMSEDGVRKVLAGRISLESLLRVADLTDRM